MEDIDKVLAYEIKKDIAERYFSFRRLIEQDSASYLESVLQTSASFEAGIGLDLVRIYILLKDQDLIEKFQRLVNIPADLFFDPYICTSPTIRQRLFVGLRVKGFTRKRRFIRTFTEIYRRLRASTVSYRQTVEQLTEEHETIVEQIKLFYRKNDLNNILSFIRSLDHPESAYMLEGAPPNDGYRESMDSKMQITAPQSAASLLPDIPALPPLESISQELRLLAKSAFLRQQDLDLKKLARTSS